MNNRFYVPAYEHQVLYVGGVADQRVIATKFDSLPFVKTFPNSCASRNSYGYPVPTSEWSEDYTVSAVEVGVEIYLIGAQSELQVDECLINLIKQCNLRPFRRI